MSNQGILVVAEPKDGKLANVTLESITQARELVATVGGLVSVVITAAETAPLVTAAGRYGADRIYVAESLEAGVFRSGTFTDAAVAAVKAAEPALVLCSGSPDGRDVAALTDFMSMLAPGTRRVRVVNAVRNPPRRSPSRQITSPGERSSTAASVHQSKRSG